MRFNNLAYASERREDRHEVHHRTCAVDPNGRELPVVIVNTSLNGLMARCDASIEPGTKLRFRLPDVAPMVAEVRWALGGRIGCEFERSIAPAAYAVLLPKLR